MHLICLVNFLIVNQSVEVMSLLMEDMTMKSVSLAKEGILLILISGALLFSVGYFLPDEVALQGATFAGGLFGYIIYVRISNWDVNRQSLRDLFAFGITLLMSLFASVLLVGACNVFSKLPLCAENRRNAFVILNFFFPMLIVFFSWVAGRWPRSH